MLALLKTGAGRGVMVVVAAGFRSSRPQPKRKAGFYLKLLYGLLRDVMILHEGQRRSAIATSETS